MRMSDNGFKSQIIHIMNTLIDSPDTAVPDILPQEVVNLESKRLLNEFYRALDSGKNSEAELIKMVFQIGAANYRAIDSRVAVTARLVADFGKAAPSPDFQRELFQRTVRRILLSSDGSLALELQNRHIAAERKG